MSLSIKQFGYKNAQLFTDTWDCLIQNGKELQHFELGFYRLLKQIPFSNFKNLRKLKSMTITSMVFDDLKPNDLVSLIENCTNLEVLKLDDVLFSFPLDPRHAQYISDYHLTI